MAVPYVFAFQTLPIPLAQLDVNFNTPITVGTTDVQLGDTILALIGMTSIGAVAGNFSGVVTAYSFVGPLTGDVTGNVSGNAGTVTDGVYVVGDQTIGGAKTFTSLISGNIDGNAGTVTNGVYTTGTYFDPAWITALSGAKITGAIDNVTIGLTVPVGGKFSYAHTGVSTAMLVGGAIDVDCALSNVFETALSGNVTSLTLSNAHDGQTINWFLSQDNTGGWTMDWGSSVKFPGGAAGGVLSTAANSMDLAVLTYRSDTGFWYGSVVKAFS